MEPIEKLQSQIEELSKQTLDTIKVLQTTAVLIEANHEELKHLKGRVDRNAENIVKIQKPGG